MTTLPTDRTANNSAIEHLADHNILAEFNNDHSTDPAAHSGTYVPFLAASGSDDGPALQALYDAGANAVTLKAGATYIINTPVFLDTNSRSKKFVIHGNGAIIRPGSGLPTTPQFTVDTTVKWAIFVNTVRGALSGGVVTATGNTANGAPVGTLRIEDVIFDGQGGNYGFVFGNTAGTAEFDMVTLMAARTLVSWTAYTDGAQLRNCQNLTPNSGSYLIHGVTNGDGIIVSGARTDSTGGLVKLQDCFGADISGLVSGVCSFSGCRNIRLGVPHIEADEQQATSTIAIDASQVIIDGGWLQASKTAGKYSIQINDTVGGSTELVLRNTALHTLIRSSETDLTPTASIYVTAFATNSRIRAEGVSGTQYADSGGVFRRGITIDSAVVAIQTALTAQSAVQHLADGNWELRRRNGAWEVVNPITRGAQIIRPMSTAPTIDQVLAGANNMVGTLTNGQTYEYAIALRDAKGNYSAASSASSTAADSAGSIRLLVTTPGTPCTLVVWRKTGTGVLAGPDRYVAIPWDAYDSTRLFDTGANINGVPWITTSVPVPNTVAAANGTRSALALDSVHLLGGAGSPEGAVVAGVGALYQRTDGGASTGTYLKASGTGNTGWVALVPTSEKAAANGIATLDGSSTIPDAQIPATIARDTEITTAVSTHDASATSHAGVHPYSAVGTNQTKTRTAGDITANNTSFTAVDGSGSLDLTIAAVAGDLILVGVSAVWDSQAVVGYLDVATWVSGAAVNYLSAGSSQGVSAWYGPTGVRTSVGGTAAYVVQAGDISGGNVVLRLMYKTSTATNRTLFANANLPLNFHAVNVG